jgi:outer membrane protein assembly factor BamB
MLKKLLIGGGLAVITVCVILFFTFRNIDSFKSAEIAEAVPSNAILFIDKIDYEYFTKDFRLENLLWNDLISRNGFANFDSLLNVFNLLVQNKPLLTRRLHNQALSFSVHLLGKNKISYIFYVPLGEDINLHNFNQEIRAGFGDDVLINSRKYEAVELTDISLNNSNIVRGFSYGIQERIFILSTSSMLLEDAIRSLNSGGGIYHNKGFKIVSKTAGKYVQANVYMNYTVLEQLFYPAVNNENQRYLRPLSGLADWGEFDVDIRENNFIFNGMSYAEDSLKGWLNVFKGQSPVRLEATSLIPSNAVEFMSLGISDKDLLKYQLKEELKIRDQFTVFQNYENKFEKVLGKSPFNDLLDLLNDEIVKFTMVVGNKSVMEGVVLYEIRSSSQAKETLERWVSIFAANKGKELKDFTDKYVLDNQTSYTIYDLPDNLYEKVVLGSFFKSSFAFYDNYLIFSDSHEAISRTIYQNILHKTLANESSFDEVNNLISTRANLTYFLKPDLFLEKNDELFTKSLKEGISSMSGTVKKIPGLIIQYSSENEMFYSNISLKYSSSVKEKAMTVWESLLDSMAIIKPELVVNHATSEKEILVQDASNSVCLLNSTGRILWQVKTESPIMSEIYQVDFYANGRLQYLFSTSQNIFLLDRNGNNVESYPVKLRSNASNGIVLFDYDNRKEYRMFVACEDRKVYAYDLSGNIVPGWTFRKSEGEVEKAIQHFRINEKDYILFSDPVRTYILDRRGKERVKIKQQEALSLNNGFYLDMNVTDNSPRFVTSDTSGNVLSIDLSGEVEILLEHKAGSEHFFRTKDLNQDGIKEYIFADENQLEVIDIKGERLFSFKIKNDISALPDIYEFSSADLKIGITDSEKNLIYLLNSDGTLYEGFPLEGNTRYTIGYFAGSDSRFNLIVGSQNGFLYNYSIE